VGGWRMMVYLESIYRNITKNPPTPIQLIYANKNVFKQVSDHLGLYNETLSKKKQNKIR
jgi:hypothetical protein